MRFSTIVSVVTLVWGISPRQPSGKNIIRWLLKKRTNGSVRYCQYTSEFEEQVKARKLSDIPDALAVNKHAQAYYGVFKKELPEVFVVKDVQVQDKWTKLAFDVDNIIVKAVAENSLNPQDIEKVVKTSLLPLLFTACREIGAGMNQVNRIVETIIQILRVGLMKS
ncbi:type I restriction enzyme HsdR protein [Escherichia coli O145:H28]|nr:hypothetical protein BX48_00005 [Escherichia coli O145:NM str. 2010C-3517]GEG43132.1 type I restriction enzyme HsdR protein [Escherichia coli O145:H28]